jgi:acetoin utilization deacetylase AcuC-like enzyme
MQGPPIPPPSDKRGRAWLLDDLRFELHQAPGHHPERPERLVAARAGADDAKTSFQRLAARPATDEELLRVHSARYIDELAKTQGRRAYLDPDTYVCPESTQIARLAAGSLAAMVEAMIAGPTPKGVALLRPPGHHARPSSAMGFCLVNNVAVAAAHALSLGLERVAIVDWDVHHGNGTQEMFWRSPSVLYVSLHQFPFYPGTGDIDEVGEGEGKGYTVNVPLAAGGDDAVYADAFERVVIPVLASYAPQLILVSAGFDAAANDPLAQMELSPGAFAWMAREVARVCDTSASGRMALVLEGGYDLVSLRSGLAGALEGMLYQRAPQIIAKRDDGVTRAAASAKKAWTMAE